MFRTVEVTNDGSTSVTIDPQLVGEGFTLVDASGTPIAPGTTITVPANDTIDVFVRLDASEQCAQDATLRLETVDLVGDVDAPVDLP